MFSRLFDDSVFSGFDSHHLYHHSESTIENIEKQYSFEGEPNGEDDDPFELGLSRIEDSALQSENDDSCFPSFIHHSIDFKQAAKGAENSTLESMSNS